MPSVRLHMSAPRYLALTPRNELLRSASASPLGIIRHMSRISIRAAAIWCLAIWAAVWCFFMVIRLSGFDIRIIPGIGPLMLVALAISVLAPVVAVGIAGASLIKRPRTVASWLILGCAVAACIIVAYIFEATRWL